MSNRTDGRKLRLRSERLRTLSGAALSRAAGGSTEPWGWDDDDNQLTGRIGSRACRSGDGGGEL